MTRSYRSIWMNGFLKLLGLVLVSSALAFPADGIIESTWSKTDSALDTNPASQFWRGARPVYMEKDSHGKPVARYRTEVRTRWTSKNLYFLFVCPYEELSLKPNPNTQNETNQLWNWDVAEVFLGSDFADIRRYKEFEISPQGEWTDLDVDLTKPHHEDGWTWDSDFQVAARIDEKSKIWYGAMKIPWTALGELSPAPGKTFRVNFFRSQGELA